MYGDLADVVDENGPLMGSDDPGMRRRASSSASTSLVDPNQVLGTLHCTMKYSFDKNALIVTVNRCVNLPAKASAAKSRYVSSLEYHSRLKHIRIIREINMIFHAYSHKFCIMYGTEQIKFW